MRKSRGRLGLATVSAVRGAQTTSSVWTVAASDRLPYAVDVLVLVLLEVLEFVDMGVRGKLSRVILLLSSSVTCAACFADSPRRC